MINSIESERLQNLIDRKMASYEKLKATDSDNPALKFLNSEITFLRDTIMPIVLCNTTVDYSEMRNFFTLAMRKIEKRPVAAKTVTDILMHYHIKNPEPGKQYIVAKASNMEERLNMFEATINYEPAIIYPL